MLDNKLYLLLLLLLMIQGAGIKEWRDVARDVLCRTTLT
jgi:hypothetical protein